MVVVKREHATVSVSFEESKRFRVLSYTRDALALIESGRYCAELRGRHR